MAFAVHLTEAHSQQLLQPTCVLPEQRLLFPEQDRGPGPVPEHPLLGIIFIGQKESQ
jgi:hypothetical protein